jgi:hypothetical protein
VNKGMFRVDSKIIAWNALEIVIIDHKCYFNAINGFEMLSFEA